MESKTYKAKDVVSALLLVGGIIFSQSSKADCGEDAFSYCENTPVNYFQPAPEGQPTAVPLDLVIPGDQKFPEAPRSPFELPEPHPYLRY